MAKNKTVETDESVTGFLTNIADEQKRKDTEAVVELIRKHTKMTPKMWGTSIVGFGAYHYKYESGREGSAALVGLAARASAITLYIPNFEGKDELLAKLGKHKTGKGCIYVSRLADIDSRILLKMVDKGIAYRKAQYPSTTD